MGCLFYSVFWGRRGDYFSFNCASRRESGKFVYVSSVNDGGILDCYTMRIEEN